MGTALPLGLDELANGPMVGQGKRKVGAVLKHFHKAGLTLDTCADERHLNRSLSTLKAYARRLKLAFPDYVPLAMRPKKEKREKRSRKV